MMRTRNSPVQPHLRPAVLLACALLLTPAACKSHDEDEKAPTPVVYVQAAHPQQGSISQEVAGDAVLAPLAQAAIQPKITAPVKKFYVQRGAHVRAGQLLAVLENKDLAAAAIDNKGSYTAAQASYATTTQATVPEDLSKARLDLGQAKATLDLDQSIVDARKALFQQGAIPGRDLDTAQATLVQAKATFDIAQQHLNSLEKVSNQAAIQNAQGTLESARGKYLGAEAQLSYTDIRSPISGVVTERPLFEGETAAAGTALITVMDTSALIAKLHLAQNQAQQLRLGAPAMLQVPGMDEPVSAKVALVSPALDPGSTTVEVWLRVDNRTGALKAGTPVHATITGRTVTNALSVPASSILTSQEGGGKYVMVITADSTAHRKPVTLGVQNSERVQVLSGINAHDMVISSGDYGLDENTKVKIGTDPGEKGDDKDAGGKGKDADDK